MEGESTEADKNVIESLADPLIHIIRNSLDHGLETAEERRAAGKSAAGQLSIRARSESDRVVIEIADDGRGIDPEIMRRKAYEKGIIDEQTLERLNDQEAVNLIFAAGFSTAAKVSDLSGRGVGMDVVRNAVARVNGSIDLKSEVGKGTRLRLSLPLSMAVTNVMIIESAGQRFGVAMDAIAETVRVPEASIQRIKQQKTTVLRGRVMPLMALNELLGWIGPRSPMTTASLPSSWCVLRMIFSVSSSMIAWKRWISSSSPSPASLAPQELHRLRPVGRWLGAVGHQSQRAAVMGMDFQENTLVISDILGVEEAESLLEWLLAHRDGQLDLTACVHLHAANLQVLMALRPAIHSWPDDPALTDWLKSAFDEQDCTHA